MQENIVIKKEFDEAEHTVLKITKELGVSIVKMQDGEGFHYNIAIVRFTDLSDQYELVDEKNFFTREKNKARDFVEGLIKTGETNEHVEAINFQKGF